jgi:hypothetical protein
LHRAEIEHCRRVQQRNIAPDSSWVLMQRMEQSPPGGGGSGLPEIDPAFFDTLIVRGTADGDRSHATQEQASDTSQVGTAVARRDQVTQQDAAAAGESTAAAEGLKRQAAQRVEAVAEFQLA